MISVLLILLLAGKHIPVFGNFLYCKGIGKISNVGFIPYQLRARIHDDCPELRGVKRTELKVTLASVHEFMGINSSLTSILVDTAQSSILEIPSNVIDSAFMTAYNNGETRVRLSVYVNNRRAFDEEINPGADTKIDLTDTVRLGLSSCALPPCQVRIDFIPDQSLNLVVKDIDVTYVTCLIKEEIVAHMLACWEKANYGHYDEDLVCFELVIPRNCYTIPLNFDESEATQIMLQNSNYCDLLPNSDYGCGNEDKVYWDLFQLRSEQNILIEFVSALNQIRVI